VLAGDEAVIHVDGHDIHFTSLDKVLWPATENVPAITKRDLVAYLADASQWLIPHLQDRPLSWVRYPEGIDGPREFHKHWNFHIPEFVPKIYIWSNKSKRATEYILVNNVPTLLWLAQIDTLELHPWYSRVVREPDALDHGTDFASSERSLIESVLNYPDFMVFDLDPYIYSGKEKTGQEPELNERALEATKDAALKLKELLDALGIESFLKSSGKTGLHVYVPIVRNLPYEHTRKIAESFGREMVRRHPDLITMEWSVPKREGRVFFDHLQNTRGKTLISLYSPRAVPAGRVAWPVLWEDLPSFSPTDYTIRTAPDFLRRHPDPWSSILDHKQDLHTLLSRPRGAFVA
jgi:bifunctional non-homologous end joining protein LigD